VKKTLKHQDRCTAGLLNIFFEFMTGQ